LYDVEVVCYAGYRGEEEPRRLRFSGREITVTAILDRWLDPAHRYFKVSGSDDGTYLLRHDTKSGRWKLKILRYGIDPGLR
jgi:hypothetical protein